MALDFFNPTPPYQPQLGSLANLNVMNALPNLQAGATNIGQATPQQFNLAEYLYPQAQNLLSQGIGTETTGQLPQGEQALLSEQLNSSIQQIKSKYAALGMSGSTAEASEIADMQTRSTGMGINLAQQLGGAEVSQAFQGLGLTAQDLQSIANEALNQMQIGQTGVTGAASIFQNMAQTQIAQDQNIASTFGSFFKALAGSGGLPGMASMFGPGGVFGQGANTGNLWVQAGQGQGPYAAQ